VFEELCSEQHLATCDDEGEQTSVRVLGRFACVHESEADTCAEGTVELWSSALSIL